MVREISRFFVAPRREFAPAVWRVSRTLLSRNTSTSVYGRSKQIRTLQVDHGGLILYFVDFHFEVLPVYPFAIPSLSNFYLPKQNRADRGTNQIKVNKMCQTTMVTLYKDHDQRVILIFMWKTHNKILAYHSSPRDDGLRLALADAGEGDLVTLLGQHDPVLGELDDRRRG